MSLISDIENLRNVSEISLCACEPWQFYRANVIDVRCPSCGLHRRITIEEYTSAILNIVADNAEATEAELRQAGRDLLLAGGLTRDNLSGKLST